MITLAIDGGQSGIRARVTETGHTVDLPAVQTHRPVVTQLAEAVAAAAPEGADRVLVGTTGLGTSDTAAALLGLLGARTKVVALAHDSVTSSLGALGDRTGVVVAAGTGVVTLGVGHTRLRRVDGWGHLIGDAGSGFWIGRAALDAVMRAYDGRGPATDLTEVVAGDFDDLEGMYLTLQSDPDRVRRIAAYARTVADLAAGDQVSRGILTRAAEELAGTVAAAAYAVDADEPVAVCRLGNVFRGEVVGAAFVAALGRLVPGAQVVEPRGTALDGAALLADLSGETALAGRVDLARR